MRIVPALGRRPDERPDFFAFLTTALRCGGHLRYRLTATRSRGEGWGTAGRIESKSAERGVSRLHTGVEFSQIHIREANAFVARFHRHSLSTAGGKFAVAARYGDRLVGVAIAGRPVARLLDDGLTLEVFRVCTDGTHNACSCLSGRVKTISRLRCYRKVITYTLAEESGASLRAVGAKPVAVVEPQGWDRPNRRRQDQPVYAKRKVRWEL